MPDPRSEFYGVVMDDNGVIVKTATATVYWAPPFATNPLTTQATVYSTETGAGVAGNPIALTSGTIDFWAPSGAYDILIQDQASPKKFADRVIRFDSIPANQGVSTAQLAPDSVDSSKVLDGSLSLADLQAIISQNLAITGEGKIWYTNTAPTGYMFCNGQAISRATYAALFAVIGTTYGAGNGTTTFNLPDLCGRSPVGAGASQNPSGSLTTRTLGARAGVERVALTVAELAAHAHGVTDNGHAHGVYDPGHNHWIVGQNPGRYVADNDNNPATARWRATPDTASPAGSIGISFTSSGTAGSGTGIGIYSAGTGVSIQNNGSGNSHENMAPYTAVNFIIKYT